MVDGQFYDWENIKSKAVVVAKVGTYLQRSTSGKMNIRLGRNVRRKNVWPKSLNKE